tara:strand:- start:48 stop:197 length:150 start_codon:yes stop_codon:yes gene_type:complete
LFFAALAKPIANLLRNDLTTNDGEPSSRRPRRTAAELARWWRCTELSYG